MFSKIMMMTMLTVSSAIELTPENWSAETEGKSVFLKFFAPWCGHCKAMKPAWDVLMEEYDSNQQILIGDVDCVGSGKALCEANGVNGFPSVKYGHPDELQDYKGGRDIDSLKSFAISLAPPCNVETLDNCDESEIEVVGQLKEVSAFDLGGRIAEFDQQSTGIETDFAESVQKLQSQYSETVAKKDKELADLKQSSNIGIVRSLLKKRQENEEMNLDEEMGSEETEL